MSKAEPARFTGREGDITSWEERQRGRLWKVQPAPVPLHFLLRLLCRDFTLHQSEEGLPAVDAMGTHAALGPRLRPLCPAPTSDRLPSATAPMSSQPVNSVALDRWP